MFNIFKRNKNTSQEVVLEDIETELLGGKMITYADGFMELYKLRGPKLDNREK